MRNVLILGNGISRLAYVKEIESFPGEVWACNYAFREFPEKITRLTGHSEPMIEAQEWKEKHGYKYDIYGGPITKKHPEWKPFTVDPKWRRDSGTTMVAQALHDGLKIELCGFDLGGPHIFDRAYYTTDKSVWVNRWAEIAEQWGLDNITFWGTDHKPFILNVLSGLENYKKYSKEYRKRKPHLEDETYKKTFKEFYMAKQKTELKYVKVKVKGKIVDMNEDLAKVYVQKGRGEIVKAEKPKTEEKKETKKTTAKPKTEDNK